MKRFESHQSKTLFITNVMTLQMCRDRLLSAHWLAARWHIDLAGRFLTWLTEVTLTCITSDLWTQSTINRFRHLNRTPSSLNAILRCCISMHWANPHGFTCVEMCRYYTRGSVLFRCKYSRKWVSTLLTCKMFFTLKETRALVVNPPY